MEESRGSSRGVRKLGDILLTVAGIVCLILPAIMLVVVAVRALAPGGIPMWSLDICEVLMWFPAYLAMGYTWRTGHHVRVTVFVDKIKGRTGRIVNLIILLVALAITGIITWAGLDACITSWRETRMTYSELPEYYYSVAIPIGLAYLLYEVVVSVKRQLKSFGNREN